jgi:hypothetical protein
MDDKEKDKRLFLPKDGFEEEASEGLGRLSREEAEEDLSELKARMERRLRRPRHIWLPAAAAVVILLVASAVYVSLFRERPAMVDEMALAEEPMRDSALIAMAEPIEKRKSISPVADISTSREAGSQRAKAVPALVIEVADEEVFYAVAEAKEEAADKVTAMGEKEAADQVAAIVKKEIAVEEVAAEEVVSEVVIVEAMPRMEKMGLQDKKERAADAAASLSGSISLPDNREAAPVGGITEFMEWVRKNIRYPEEVLPRTRQVVLVVFRVRADSTVYDLRAERTPGEPFTEEAFRLLREGPGWVPVVRNGQVVDDEARVTVVFK